MKYPALPRPAEPAVGPDGQSSFPPEILRINHHLAVLAFYAIAFAAVLVMLYYVDRIFAPSPLYVGDEGAYLARSLLAPVLEGKPLLFPQLWPLENTVYFWMVRIIEQLTLHVLPWVRVMGLSCYLGALLLLHHYFTRNLPKRDRLWILVLLLAFPYYRFVVAAMPEGPYVLAVALAVVATAAWMPGRPVLHAISTGAIAAIATLIKPHGVVLVLALAAAVLAHGMLTARRSPRVIIHMAILALSFLLTGATIQYTLALSPVAPMQFFLGNGYAGLVRAPIDPSEAVRVAALAFLGMGATVMILAGPPLLVGIVALGRKFRERSSLNGADCAFLFIVFATVGTISMVTLFTYQVSFDPSETSRIQGRYLEFFVPLAWLTAASHLADWRMDRRGRFLLATPLLLGVLVLGFTLLRGVVIFPWDATAISAFYLPDLARWPLETGIPSFQLACAGTLGVIAAVLAGFRSERAWAAFFVILGLISTQYDRAWFRTIIADKTALEVDLKAVQSVVGSSAEPLLVVAQFNAAHLAFLTFGGRAAVRVPGRDQIPAEQVQNYGTVIVFRPAPRPEGNWNVRFEGRMSTVLTRQ